MTKTACGARRGRRRSSSASSSCTPRPGDSVSARARRPSSRRSPRSCCSRPAWRCCAAAAAGPRGRGGRGSAAAAGGAGGCRRRSPRTRGRFHARGRSSSSPWRARPPGGRRPGDGVSVGGDGAQGTGRGRKGSRRARPPTRRCGASSTRCGARRRASRPCFARAASRSRLRLRAGELAPAGLQPISSPFGLRWGRLHPGIDIPAPIGTPIRAADTGIVLLAGHRRLRQLHLHPAHRSLSTCYGHQSRILVRAGEDVRAGQAIGLSGNTGFSTGPHLHFETRVNGRSRGPDAVPQVGRAASTSRAGRAGRRAHRRGGRRRARGACRAAARRPSAGPGDPSAASTRASSSPPLSTGLGLDPARRRCGRSIRSAASARASSSTRAKSRRAAARGGA